VIGGSTPLGASTISSVYPVTMSREPCKPWNPCMPGQVSRFHAGPRSLDAASWTVHSALLPL